MSESPGVAVHAKPVDVEQFATALIRACARLTETEPATLADRLFGLTLGWPDSEATETMRAACNAILHSDVEF